MSLRLCLRLRLRWMAVLRWWRVHPVIVAGAPRDLPTARSLRYRLSVPVVGVHAGILVMLRMLRSDLRRRRVVHRRGLLLVLRWMLGMRMRMRVLLMRMMWMGVRMGMGMGVSPARHARHDKISDESMVEVGGWI